MTFVYYIMLTALGAFGIFLGAFGVCLQAGRFLRSIVTYGNDH